MDAIATDPQILRALAHAAAAPMTPEQIHDQRRSFVRGMCPDNRDYAEWCKLVDRVVPPLKV